MRSPLCLFLSCCFCSYDHDQTLAFSHVWWEVKHHFLNPSKQVLPDRSNMCIYIYIKLITSVIFLVKQYMSVDLNFSFIRDPSFLAKKPKFCLPALYFSPKYVVFMFAMYMTDVKLFHVNGFYLHWQIRNKHFTVC